MRVTHKFRCEFGKSRLIRDKEPVLVAYSGGRNSRAMVHLIQEVITCFVSEFYKIPIYGELFYQVMMMLKYIAL